MEDRSSLHEQIGISGEEIVGHLIVGTDPVRPGLLPDLPGRDQEGILGHDTRLVSRYLMARSAWSISRPVPLVRIEAFRRLSQPTVGCRTRSATIRRRTQRSPYSPLPG